MLGIEILKRLGGDSTGAGGGNPIILTDDVVAGTAYAQWTLGFDGFTYKRRTSGAAVQGQAWINPQSGMNLYEVKATVSTGDTPDGTIGSWLNAGSSQTWGFAAATSGASCDLDIQIRRVSDSVVVDEAMISLRVAGLQ